jgi:hypothetical protein
VIEVASIVLFAGDAARTGAFHRAVGIALEEEDHGARILTEHQQRPLGTPDRG